jgi:hypothetical protein
MAEPKVIQNPDAASKAIAKRGLWFNTIVLSVGFGLCCGLALLFATFLSLAVTGEQAGMFFLDLLGVFMPGYTASIGGAWVGFFWAFVYAAISGGIVYQIYMRAARGAPVIEGASAGPRRVARLSGSALGLALGSIFALQLFLSTAWLIVRGTAEESQHAMLMANYLPGYSVTWGGAIIGAIWLFVYTLVLFMLFARIYNVVARMRAKGERSDGRSA